MHICLHTKEVCLWWKSVSFTAPVKQQPSTSAGTSCLMRNPDTESRNKVCPRPPACLASPEGQCQSTEIKAASSSAWSQATSVPGSGRGREQKQQNVCSLRVSCSVPSTVLKPHPGSCPASLTFVMLLLDSGPMLFTYEKMVHSRKIKHTKQSNMLLPLFWAFENQCPRLQTTLSKYLKCSVIKIVTYCFQDNVTKKFQSRIEKKKTNKRPHRASDMLG